RSVRHQGVTFTVKNVIADNSRMILFYTLDADHLDVVNLESVQLLDKNKDPLPASVGFDPDGKHKGKITASYGPSYQLQSAVYLKIRLTERSKTWTDTVKIPLDLAKIKDMKHVLPVNQTVHFGQQAVSVEKGIVYPTRIAVYVKFDPENSKRIFGFDQLQLVDGKGQVWSSMRDGVSASGISPTERILYFESNYFREPKALFLEGHNIRALDKDKLDLVVDLKHHQLLQKPDDRIALTDITETQKTITVKLALETDPSWDSHRSYNLFRSTYRDAAGRTYENMLRSGTASTDENAKQLITFTIKKEPFQGPLTFQLMDYPNHVEKAFRVRVK
ncbi:MAG TPA: DUF4179 domain-containing protein, partial [Bacillales bacterium]|nr:DUF4179 domain-containing protein [Bacillales bacterium]